MHGFIPLLPKLCSRPLSPHRLSFCLPLLHLLNMKTSRIRSAERTHHAFSSQGLSRCLIYAAARQMENAASRRLLTKCLHREIPPTRWHISAELTTVLEWNRPVRDALTWQQQQSREDTSDSGSLFYRYMTVWLRLVREILTHIHNYSHQVVIYLHKILIWKEAAITDCTSEEKRAICR